MIIYRRGIFKNDLLTSYGLDMSTGEEMNWKRLLAVMVAELIVLVFLFDLYLFWRYEKGVIHWIMGKCYRACKGTVFLCKILNETHALELFYVCLCFLFICCCQVHSKASAQSDALFCSG